MRLLSAAPCSFPVQVGVTHEMLTPAEVQAADEQIFADTRIEDCEVDPALYAANRLTDAERKQFDEQGYVSSAGQVFVDSAPCCCNPVPG